MNFASDNAYGALPQVLQALVRANDGAAKPYGADPLTGSLAARFAALFERDVAVYPVVTGTAANALALACLTPPHGAVFCHAQSHIMDSECGAPEFYAHGAKLIGIEGEDGKLSLEAIIAAIDAVPRGFVHTSQPFMVSLSQPTEMGTLYSPVEITAIAQACHERGLKLHLDGARFACALESLGASPAGATWRCGVDVLSFGASRGCEAVRGVGTCGGTGLFALLAVLIIQVVLGSLLLKGAGVFDPTSTSFLAVGLVAVLALLFFLSSLESVWMLLVIPVLTAITFLLSWWVTETFVEAGADDNIHR